MSEQKQRCSESIWRSDGRWSQKGQCMKAASVVVEGKPYCKTHSPEGKQKREQKSEERYQALSRANQRRYAIERSEREVIEAAKEWFASPEKESASADALAIAVARLRDAEAMPL